MKMNKIAALGAAAVTALSLAGCGGSSSAKTVTMATSPDFAPWEYMDGDKVVGIDPEIAQAIADEMGVTLKIESMSFDSIIPAVASGKADFGMAGFTVTDERKEQVDFSDTYTTSIQKIMVRKDSDIKSYEDLEGKTVAVEMGTTGAADVEGDTTVKMTPDEYKTYGDVITALKTSKVDAAVLDSLPAEQFAEQNDDLTILDDEPYGQEAYAAVFKKGSDMTEKYNEALKKLTDDGTIEKIMDKYIGSENEGIASSS
ncbi:MAG: transporter substrate-binding domain-containing protein [Eubacterium sp.]|nr:transporter substrate-binding domain-containing protein [Eubacterium sp.]